MEQDAKRVGRQAPEPGNDDGTGCQKSRETSPGTQEMMMEQDARKVGRQAPEP